MTGADARLDRLYDALKAHGCHPKRRGNTHITALCPIHEVGVPGKIASLKIDLDLRSNKVLINCQAGCDSGEVLAAIGMSWADISDHPGSPNGKPIVVAEYPYRDENEVVLYVKERYEPKDFRIYRPLSGGRRKYKDALADVRRVLFDLPELRAGIDAGRAIYLCEGEKDARRICEAGHIATTWDAGAWKPGSRSKWRPEYTNQLRGAVDIYIVGDRDDQGRATAADIKAKLEYHGFQVTILEPIVGKDVSEHLDAGYTLIDLVQVDEDHPPEPLNDATRRIRLTPLSSIKPRPVRWAWADRIPNGELTLTPGRGGLGKSTFHAWVIAHLTRGTLPGVHFGKPRPCIIAASEDSYERTVVPRLIAAGADMDLVHRVDVITETNEVVSISLPRDVERLTVEIKRVGVALLSLDPVMSLLFSELDTHKDREMRLALEPLARLADRTGCAVLGNAHFNKSTGSDPLMLIMGSSAFGNVARAALGFARDTEDDSCVISQVKNNLGRLDLPSLRYRIDSAIVDTEEGPADVGKLVMDGESKRSVADILRDRGTDDDNRSERDEAVNWLLDYLTSQGGSAKAADAIEAAAEHGIAKTTLTRARRPAKVRSAKSSMTGGWVWTLEESTEGTEEAKNQKVDSSDSSVDSSGEAGTCQVLTWRVCKNPKCGTRGGCILADTDTTKGNEVEV
jgi:hypothetical protein